MRPVVLAHGTWSRADTWYQPGGALHDALAARGYPVYSFKWSGVLGGVNEKWLGIVPPGDPAEARLGADDGSLLFWLDAAEKLKLFCEANGLSRPHMVSHSHGLQVVVYSAAIGQQFQTHLSLSGPVRRDMQRARRAARPNIQRWIQVADPKDDRTIEAGQELDGSGLGFTYDIPEADENIHVPGAGHSGLTRDVAAWTTLDLWRFLD